MSLNYRHVIEQYIDIYIYIYIYVYINRYNLVYFYQHVELIMARCNDVFFVHTGDK